MASVPLESRLRVNGIELVVFEWPGKDPALLFAHATGFHARCWDQVIGHVPDRHCYAIDLRGHGRSDKPAPPYPWRLFGEDIAALVRTLGLTHTIAIGHSMGGHAVTLAAALEPARFSALLLLDPVILPRAMYGHPFLGEHFAARRRNEWPSPEAMFERFKDRLPFSRWQPAVLRDYCTYGLLPAPEGDGFVLACPPAVEASIYAGSAGTDIYDAIGTIEVPVQVVRSGQKWMSGTVNMSASPTVPDLATQFHYGQDICLTEYSHFIPMEAPGLVARYSSPARPSQGGC